MADDIDNQDIIDALKQSATGVKLYPGKGPTVQPDTPFANWSQGMGEALKTNLTDLAQHPENLVGPGELGVMAGPLARTANMGNYHKAMDMLLGGRASKERMFDKTGWFPRTGPGQLAHEISDSDMKALPLSSIKGSSEVIKPLSDVISHQKLFKAYPEAKDIPVHIDPSYGDDWAGIYNYPKPGHITLGGEANKAGLNEIQQGGLIHEVQHWIQSKEGWMSGAGGAEGYEKLLRKAAANKLSGLGGDDPRRTEIYQVLKALDKKKEAPDVSVWDTPQYQMYTRHPIENEATNVDNRHAFDVFGKTRRIPYATDPEELAALLKQQGLTWGQTYGSSNFGPSIRSGRPTKWDLYQYGTSNKVNPETLDPYTREMWDRLPTYHDQYDRPAEMIGDRKYPWKTEMYPSHKVYDYALGLDRVLRGGK
jgi:hypothetical protein